MNNKLMALYGLTLFTATSVLHGAQPPLYQLSQAESDSFLADMLLGYWQDATSKDQQLMNTVKTQGIRSKQERQAVEAALRRLQRNKARKLQAGEGVSAAGNQAHPNSVAAPRKVESKEVTQD